MLLAQQCFAAVEGRK